MEIRYEPSKEVSFEINSANITGIATSNHNEIISVLALENIDKVDVYLDNNKISLEEKDQLKQRISVIKEFNSLFFIKTVEDYMNYIIKKDLLKIKDPVKKKTDSLRIVGLDQTYLKREIETLSSSEKFELQLAVSLLSNPNILIFDNPFTYLDLQQEKKLIQLVTRLKEQFSKTIIFIDDNSDKLYKYTNKMLFIKNNEIILSAPTSEAYTRVDFLKKNRFKIPSIIQITYLAKKSKGTKIIYHKDVRDLIKDIYKHV